MRLIGLALLVLLVPAAFAQAPAAEARVLLDVSSWQETGEVQGVLALQCEHPAHSADGPTFDLSAEVTDARGDRLDGFEVGKIASIVFAPDDCAAGTQERAFTVAVSAEPGTTGDAYLVVRAEGRSSTPIALYGGLGGEGRASLPLAPLPPEPTPTAAVAESPGLCWWCGLVLVGLVARRW